MTSIQYNQDLIHTNLSLVCSPESSRWNLACLKVLSLSPTSSISDHVLDIPWNWEVSAMSATLASRMPLKSSFQTHGSSLPQHSSALAWVENGGPTGIYICNELTSSVRYCVF